MPIYRIGPQANKYQGIDPLFYERQLNAKQARSDANRAAWSEMIQEQGNVARLDDEAYQHQIESQNAMWDDIMNKNKGNMALATDDVLRGIQASKTSPYWNVNARHVKEMTEREKLLSAYGSEAIDRSKGLDGTPLFDKDSGKYMSASSIKADVVKANQYGKSVEEMLAQTSPHIQEVMSELGVEPNTPEYYKAVKTYTESLSREELYQIVSQPSVQRAFLANNPTALIDNRQYGNTGMTYQDMFSSPEGIADFMYGNIQDKFTDKVKSENVYKENKRFTQQMREDSQKRVAKYKQGLADESAEAERIRNLAEAYTPMSTTVPGQTVNDATIKNAQENINALTGDTEGSIPNLEKNIEVLKSEISTKFKIPENKAITVSMIDDMLANDEVLSDSGRRELISYRENLNGLMNSKVNLNNEYNSSMAIINSVNNVTFDKFKKSKTKDEWDKLLEYYDGDESALNKVLNGGGENSWIDRGLSTYQNIFSPEISYSLKDELKDLVWEYNDFKDKTINEGKDFSQESTYFDYTDSKSAGYQLNEQYKLRAEKNGKQDVALYTNVRGENALNAIVTYDGDEMTVDDVLDLSEFDNKVKKKLYKHETHFGINGQRQITLVPTEFGKGKGAGPIQVGQFTYDKDNKTINNGDLNFLWKMHQQTRGVNYSPADKAQNMAWLSGNIAAKLPGGQEILADATEMLDVARKGLGDNSEIFRVGDVDYFVNGRDIYAKASDGRGGVQNIPVSYDQAMFIPLERKTKQYYNSQEFRNNKETIENTRYKNQNKIVGNKYSYFGAGSDPIK